MTCPKCGSTDIAIVSDAVTKTRNPSRGVPIRKHCWV